MSSLLCWNACNQPNQMSPDALRPNQLVPGSLRPNQLFPGSLRPNQLFPGALRSNQLFPGALRPNQLFPGALRPNQLFPGTLESYLLPPCYPGPIPLPRVLQLRPAPDRVLLLSLVLKFIKNSPWCLGV